MRDNSEIVAGIDEVGRGCIAGAVIAAAVILNPKQPIQGLDDSKKLSPKRRQQLSEEIQASALAWSIGRADVTEIDRINILQASLLAMQRAILALPVQPERAWVDGNRLPDLQCPATAIIGGDQLVAEISAASIIAKQFRDNEMQWLDKLIPGYRFAQHKGYPTKLHLECLDRNGVSPIHRTSFGPVKQRLTG